MVGKKPGPAPTPTTIVELRGNPGKRARKPEPKPNDASLATPPGLTPIAIAFWKRHAPEMSRLGLLTVNDVDSFSACCEAWAFMEQAKDTMRSGKRSGAVTLLTTDRAHGGERRKHPAFTIYRQAESSYLVWAREFGLTPSSRVGLPVPGGDGDDDDLFD